MTQFKRNVIRALDAHTDAIKNLTRAMESQTKTLKIHSEIVEYHRTSLVDIEQRLAKLEAYF